MQKLSEENKKIIFQSIVELKKVLNQNHRKLQKGSRGGAQVGCICGNSQTCVPCSGLAFIKSAIIYNDKEMLEFIGKTCL